LAFQEGAAIEVDEFRTLNRCLDNAIADAVTEFSFQNHSLAADKGVQAWNEQLGFLAHELRNLIHSAMLAVDAMKGGNVGLTGATGAVLDRSLLAMTNLIDRSLADVRTTAGRPAHHRLISLADFVADVNAAASLETRTRTCKFTVSTVPKELAIDVDRDMLFSAVINLLQNAFKFTKPQTEVSLKIVAIADRIRIDVADHCGGLPPGTSGKMFLPFTQISADKSGVGLGLSMSRRSVEANNGVLSVRDIPGSGCVFTIDLPRHVIP
jgi:signal transduction histidine kinase